MKFKLDAIKQYVNRALELLVKASNYNIQMLKCTSYYSNLKATCLPEQEEGASLKCSDHFMKILSACISEQLEIYFITRKCGKNENKQSINYVLTGIVEYPQRNSE